MINSAQGNALNLVVQRNGEDPLSQIRAHLEAHGLEVFSSTQSRPSLDDVYLAATGQTLLDAELAAVEVQLRQEKVVFPDSQSLPSLQEPSYDLCCFPNSISPIPLLTAEFWQETLPSPAACLSNCSVAL